MVAHRWVYLVIAVALGFSLLNPARTVATDPKDGPSLQPFAVTASTAISSLDGPLTRVEISADLNCAVSHIDDSDPEFFSDTACATLVVVGGTLYGPWAIPAGQAAGPRTAFTPISQSGVTGSGSGADPFQIVTEVSLGSSGLRLVQTDSYVVGEESYRTDVELINDTPTAQFATVYRAGDCYLQNSDLGFGAADAATGSVACIASDDGGQTPGDRREEWIPITAGSHYIEARYNEVWAAVGTQQALPNTDRATEYIDNGAGLSWAVTPPGNGSRRISHLTSFSPELVSAGLCLNGGTPDYVGADAGQPGITVWYDPQNLVDPRRSAYNEEAQLIAETIQERATSTLARYAQLGFAVPVRVEIFVICDVTFGRDAVVLGEDHVEVSSDQFRTWFAPTVVNYSRGLGWHPPSATAAGWRNLVDHELFHTLQYKVSPVIWDWGRGDHVRREASATAAQDLIDPTIDDTDLRPQFDAYIQQTTHWFLNGPGPVSGPLVDGQEYDVGVVLQYWGERYGPSGEIDLERRVANSLKALIETPDSVQLEALGRFLGYDYGTGTYPGPSGAKDVALNTFREFLVASYVHAGDNADVFPEYQFLDELVSHAGAVVGSLPKYPDLPFLQVAKSMPALWDDQRLESGRGLLYPVDLPVDATTATVSLSRGIDLSGAGELRIAGRP